MTDPIADAAAQLNDAAPSSTEPSVIDEIKEGLHDLGEKVEHFIHPEAHAGIVGESITGSGSSGSAASIDPSTSGDLPNAGASPADGQSASGTSSSASPVSHVAGTAEARISADRERALVAVGKLRAYLWTFTGDVMQHLHRELDVIESMFK